MARYQYQHGDKPLAEGYPNYVWEDDWSYDPAAAKLSTVISPNLVPVSLPEVDISMSDLSPRQKTSPARVEIKQQKQK